MASKHIRNFCIIAHVDHGKSTLADRMLEITKTIPPREMREQVLDQMDLERERGITIKMQPVRMAYTLRSTNYVLNLIDTPGHIDFSYEVSRALRAVEGAVLLIDATQGIQAQTLTTLEMAERIGLVVIPAITKVDSPLARIEDVKKEISELLHIDSAEIQEVSGKSGEGVKELLAEIIKRVPSPQESSSEAPPRGLIFDFEYSEHRGILLHMRLFDGTVRSGETIRLKAGGQSFTASEVGVFSPRHKEKDALSSGEIGYIVTGIKEPGVGLVGDTLIKDSHTDAFPGYQKPIPVVWASIFPESGGKERGDDYSVLKQSLARLHLSDAAFSYEEQTNDSLGRGFRCGFLGMLHLEIILERLKREFNLSLVLTAPTVSFSIFRGEEKEVVYIPSRFPDYGSLVKVSEPWAKGEIVARGGDLGGIIRLRYQHEGDVGDSTTFGRDRVRLLFTMPLRELYRNFFEELKSISSGYASLAYTLGEERAADIVRLDILVAEEVVPALSRVVSRKGVDTEARRIVERLRDILPRQLFATKIQGKAMGRIIASETLKASRKDVTGYLYGGDVTRKMKLLEKQKKGKKKLLERGKVNIPHETFLRLLRSND